MVRRATAGCWHRPSSLKRSKGLSELQWGSLRDQLRRRPDAGDRARAARERAADHGWAPIHLHNVLGVVLEGRYWRANALNVWQQTCHPAVPAAPEGTTLCSTTLTAGAEPGFLWFRARQRRTVATWASARQADNAHSGHRADPDQTITCTAEARRIMTERAQGSGRRCSGDPIRLAHRPVRNRRLWRHHAALSPLQSQQPTAPTDTLLPGQSTSIPSWRNGSSPTSSTRWC